MDKPSLDRLVHRLDPALFQHPSKEGACAAIERAFNELTEGELRQQLMEYLGKYQAGEYTPEDLRMCSILHQIEQRAREILNQI